MRDEDKTEDYRVLLVKQRPFTIYEDQVFNEQFDTYIICISVGLFSVTEKFQYDMVSAHK